MAPNEQVLAMWEEKKMIRSVESRIKFNNTSDLSKRRHLARIERILDSINTRFDLRHSNQIKLKHIRWLLNTDLKKKSFSTQKDYIRSLRILLLSLNRENWISQLKLKSAPSKGGRPSKIKVTSLRIRH